jgi:hypothetical protein
VLVNNFLKVRLAHIELFLTAVSPPTSSTISSAGGSLDKKIPVHFEDYRRLVALPDSYTELCRFGKTHVKSNAKLCPQSFCL